MDGTKTTLYLPTDLHRRLKAAAATHGTTVSRLLAEGAEAVLARFDARGTREDLERRAREAWERMRGGLFADPTSSASDTDDLVYGDEDAT